MGNPCAPSIANLYTAEFEEQFLLNVNNNLFFNNLIMVRRFFYDYFIVYKDSEQIL